MNDPFAHKSRAQRAARRTVDTLVGSRWGSIKNVSTERPAVALTFDDGPDARWTPQILDILADNGFHATFFMLVEQARRFPDLVRRVVAEGHEVGLHGPDHSSLVGGSRRATRVRLEAAASDLAAIAGVPIRFFRPPFGAQTVSTFLAERDTGLQTVMWDVDSFDWRDQDECAVAADVVDRAAPGTIVLMHDTLADDPESGFDRAVTMQMIVDGLTRNGMRSTTVSELLAMGDVRRAAYFSLSIGSLRASAT